MCTCYMMVDYTSWYSLSSLSMQRPSRFEVLYHPKSIFVSVIFIVSTIFDRNTDIGKALLPFSKIMPKTLHRSKSKIWSSTHFFFSSFVCVYTNKYNILCRFYVILFGHFYIKKYNSVPLYFIASKFNKMSKLKKDIKYNGTLLYFLM